MSFKLGYELLDGVRVFNGFLVLWRYDKIFFCIFFEIYKVIILFVNFFFIEWVGEIVNLGMVLLGLRRCLNRKFLKSDYVF